MAKTCSPQPVAQERPRHAVACRTVIVAPTHSPEEIGELLASATLQGMHQLGAGLGEFVLESSNVVYCVSGGVACYQVLLVGRPARLVGRPARHKVGYEAN